MPLSKSSWLAVFKYSEKIWIVRPKASHNFSTTKYDNTISFRLEPIRKLDFVERKECILVWFDQKCITQADVSGNESWTQHWALTNKTFTSSESAIASSLVRNISYKKTDANINNPEIIMSSVENYSETDWEAENMICPNE